MSSYPWKPEYSVNIRSIDAQHQKLVGMINDLFDAMKVGKGKETVERLLIELIDYTKVHFTEEERLLQANNYPGLLAQQGEHRRLIQQVLEYQQQWKAGKPVTIEFSQFLKNWLTQHILVEDMKYSKFLVAKGVK